MNECHVEDIADLWKGERIGHCHSNEAEIAVCEVCGEKEDAKHGGGIKSELPSKEESEEENGEVSEEKSETSSEENWWNDSSWGTNKGVISRDIRVVTTPNIQNGVRRDYTAYGNESWFAHIYGHIVLLVKLPRSQTQST